MSNFPINVNIPSYRDHYNGLRTQKVSKIAIHHVAGVMTAKSLGDFFAGGSRYASSNYGIGYDGSVGLYVPEEYRAYTTSSRWCDDRAITIEVSNSKAYGDWPVSAASIEKLIELCVYICKKYGITNCSYTGDTDGVLQKHRWYSSTSCPGPYLDERFAYISKEVNKRLGEQKVEEKPAVIVTPSPTGVYVVKKGDMLWRIAKAHGVSVSDILRENPQLKDNPDHIMPGWKLVIKKGPERPKTVKKYTVKKGDVLWRIAKENSTYVERIVADNPIIKDPSLIQPGWVLDIVTYGARPETTKPKILVGSIVRVKRGAPDYNGNGLLDFVYDREHRVSELSGNRAVITHGGVTVAAVHIDNLILV